MLQLAATHNELPHHFDWLGWWLGCLLQLAVHFCGNGIGLDLFYYSADTESLSDCSNLAQLTSAKGINCLVDKPYHDNYGPPKMVPLSSNTSKYIDLKTYTSEIY